MPARSTVFPLTNCRPRMFSFNNPFGACETCTGLGTFIEGGSRPA